MYQEKIYTYADVQVIKCVKHNKGYPLEITSFPFEEGAQQGYPL